MRCLFGFLCVCALGLMPLVACETADDGGTGGTAGGGGSAGSGGMPECQSPRDCDDGNECTEDTCDAGMCTNAALSDGAVCEEGACQSGACEPLTSIFPCTEQGIRDAIEEGGGPHGFACDGARTVVPELPIDIDKDVILDGERKLTVDGDVARVGFSVVRDVTAELRRFAVENGAQGIRNSGTLTVTDTTIFGASNTADARDDFGGGIDNNGTLTLVSSTVSGNSSGFGGGIFSSTGTLTLVNSAVSGNTATSAAGSAGGGIAFFGAATLTNSTVSGNTSSDLGGGILAVGDLALTNSTVSDNTAGGDGGGILAAGDLALTNSTVSDNTAGGDGGGIFFNNGIHSLTHSTVSGNTSSNGAGLAGFKPKLTNTLVDNDCNWLSAVMSGGGYNIESPGNTCGFNEAKGDKFDVTEEELNLGPLRDNGGPTQTHALERESVAIDAIPAEDCVDAEGAPLTTDQRGEPRPESGGTMCDVGSFELQPDCTGAQDRTDCRPPRVGFSCLYEHCVANQCDDVADGTLCGWQLIGDAYLRVCEAGMCTAPEDCTGIPDGVECTGGDGGFCEGGECVTPP